MHLRARLAVGAVAFALVLFLSAGRAFATAVVSPPQPNQVTQKADDVEPAAAVKTGITIYPNQATARKHPLVVYSVNAPQLASTERVHIAGSNHMSYCTDADTTPGSGNAGSPCKSLTGGSAPDPYLYTVHIEIHDYQASSATA